MKKNIILNPLSMFVVGLLLGVLSRILDIYTQNLGNIFSEMSIWILFGTLISIYSKSKKSCYDKYFSVLCRYAYYILFCGIYNKRCLQ